MQIIFEEIGTLFSTMSVKYSVVAYTYFVRNMKVLYALRRILHVWSLSDIRYNCCVETLNLEFKLSYPKNIIRFKINYLARAHFHEDAARLIIIIVKVLN